MRDFAARTKASLAGPLVAILLYSAHNGCGRRSSGAPPELPPLDVLFAGCAEVERGPVCRVDKDATLRVAAAHGASLTARFEPGSGSQLVSVGKVATLRVPDGATALVVEAADRKAFRLPLARPDGIVATALSEAKRHKDEGRFDAARAALEPLLTAANPDVRAHAKSLAGRVSLARGDDARAITELRDAAALHRASFRLLAEAHDSFALAFALIVRTGDFPEARRALDALSAPSLGLAEVAAEAPYYRGLLAFELGEFGAALAAMDDAIDRATTIDLASLSLQVRITRAGDVLRALGRREEATAELRAIVASTELGACARAAALDDLGWIALDEPDPSLLAEQAREAETWLVRARDEFASGCPSPPLQANTVTNLALARFAGKDLRGAREALGTLGPRSLAPRVESYRIDVSAALELAEGRPRRALALYTQLASFDPSVAAAQRAAAGRARALEALGEREKARKSWDDVERALDSAIAAVPLGQGRDTFLSQRERLAAEHVAFLLRQRDAVAASLIARRSRSRLLRTVVTRSRVETLDATQRARWEQAVSALRSARDAWERAVEHARLLPADRQADARRSIDTLERDIDGRAKAVFAELGGAPTVAEPRAPVSGELLLVYHPIPSGWAAFAVDAQGAANATLPAVLPSDAGALAQALFGQFLPAIGRAERITVLATGKLRDVDFHALPFDGAPLVLRRVVAYGLDLPPAFAPRVSEASLVISDPQGNLPAARVDAEALGRALEARGPVVSLRGSQATRERMQRELSTTDALWYEGHARFAGREGWQSELPLAHGGLRVADVLSLPLAPRAVVLGACEGARDDAKARVPGLGIAQAFVAAGSAAVIAATRAVDDRAAAGIVLELASRDPKLKNPPFALHEAQVAIIGKCPTWDWAAFRALVR